jgi:hypothetical protein
MGIGDWGLGIWGLGIGPNPQSPIPNPQSPIPNPQIPKILFFLKNLLYLKKNKFNSVYFILLILLSDFIHFSFTQ